MRNYPFANGVTLSKNNPAMIYRFVFQQLAQIHVLTPPALQLVTVVLLMLVVLSINSKNGDPFKNNKQLR